MFSPINLPATLLRLLYNLFFSSAVAYSVLSLQYQLFTFSSFSFSSLLLLSKYPVFFFIIYVPMLFLTSTLFLVLLLSFISASLFSSNIHLSTSSPLSLSVFIFAPSLLSRCPVSFQNPHSSSLYFCYSFPRFPLFISSTTLFFFQYPSFNIFPPPFSVSSAPFHLSLDI